MTREVKDWRWFSGSLSVGIVMVEDEYEGRLYYIGPSNDNSEVKDVQWIAAWGAKFPQAAGDVLFGVTKNG